jgi:hypothetical protein
MSSIEHDDVLQNSGRRLARLVFFTFVLTFVAARVLVFSIMSQKLPDLFFHVGGTHVHHLNYGIFVLCGVGAYLLFAHPADRRLRIAAVLYAIGLALTFDEFGMWLHLGGSYWQRASYDAIAVIAGTLGFIAFFPSRQALRRWPWWQAAAVAAVCIVFFFMLADSFRHIDKKLEPKLEQIEQKGPK